MSSSNVAVKLYKMSASKSKHKIDFRRELTFKEKKVAEIKREKMRVLADIKPVPKFMITVDLSHARGNLDALRMVLKELEWKEFPFGRKDQNCDIHWHCMTFEQNPDVYGGMVSKFPGMNWICSKNNLFRVLDQMRALYPDEYDFYPRTWYLPDQLHQLAHDIKRMNEKRVKPRPTFIVKPDTGAQGEGIYLIRDVGDYLLNNGRVNVCQEYLGDVFLIDKFKFDLRVYAVLRSVEPLELYVCKEGLARFSTVPYETPTNKNIHEAFMHLTNYSLNKKSATFNRSERDDEGSKRTLTSVFTRMKRMGCNTDKLWRRIEHIIVKTMIAIIPDLKIEMLTALPPNKPGPSCFQILGFDILLLNNLKPMLLEINSTPSLRVDGEVEVSPGIVDYVPSPKDEEVKLPLIRDTLLLVAPQKKIKYLESWREEVYGQPLLMSSFPSEREKKRRARREKRQQKREEMERSRKEHEENRPPMQLERDGVIHVETNHPRSSIIIIKSNDDEPPNKNLNKESSFMLPTDKNNKILANHNENNVTNNEYDMQVDSYNNVTFDERTSYIDKQEVDDTGAHENYTDHDYHSRKVEGDCVLEDFDRKDQNHYSGNENGYHDNDMEESSSSDDEQTDSEPYESSLKQIYPEPLAGKYECLRLYEKLADVFMVALGVRATQRLGPTGFRTFARKCRLTRKGITNATIDILFIDMQRKWEHVNAERTTGLCFRGFLDACHEIARRKFTNVDMLRTIEDFIEYCEDNLKEDQLFQSRCNPRLLPRRARPHGYPLLEPMVNPITSPLSNEEESSTVLDSRLRSRQYLKPRSAEDVDKFLNRHRRLAPVRRTKSRKEHRKINEEDET